MRSEAARFRTARYEGNYQGESLRAAFRRGPAAAQLSLPYYHLVRNGLGTRGFGDLLFSGRFELSPLDERLGHVSALLAVSLPTGDAHRDLGMGHWMLAPGLAGSVNIDRYTLDLSGGYAHSLGDGGHHQHAAGSSPIVDPMNHSELFGALFATVRASEILSTRLGWYGASPIFASGGVARAAASFGGDVHVGRVRFSLEAHLPLLGDAFRGKLAAELGYSF